jgi:glycosyltransferase involved in cell wall biosynthesis
MSMPDNEWTRGKVGCKMLQYMANAIPSVVSYTPTTAEVIENGINGFLASSEEEWIEKLSSLIENPQLRDRIGRAGRQTAEERFAINVNMSRYIEIFKSCIR